MGVPVLGIVENMSEFVCPKCGESYKIFGEKAADIRDTSMTLSPGIEGVVVNIEVFQRNERGRARKTCSGD